MEQIIIVNKRNRGTDIPKGYSVIDVSRTSVFGNPFHMADESQRSAVCVTYSKWFKEAVKYSFDMADNPGKVPEAFPEALKELIRRAVSGEKLALSCWCAPKQYHAETIKYYLESNIAFNKFCKAHPAIKL